MNGVLSKNKTKEVRDLIYKTTKSIVGEISPIDDESIKIEFVTTNGVPYKETIYTQNKGFSGGNLSEELKECLPPLLDKLL